MRNDIQNLLAVAVLGACIAVPAQSAMYKWVDENGRTQYGDRIPEKYQTKGNQEISKGGLITKKNDAALTPEQLKAREEEAAAQKGPPPQRPAAD